ncbi:hypothetical protein [Leptolyngbya sp. FACHB-261]|uniref:hypothetical protein n=1 Tax=Leptolyngbya sp. FACHB-261 TaxID=2692806 RepID=UPI001682134E|nr:hypothetical protein [Leptolyngbya sp. FACHB-261]MBD2104455.1 hypothetical protein [Leptolyngbya sp. FACHB-261]
MNFSHLSPSQIRLQLWDHISRELNLSNQAKLILLIIANYTDPRSLRASVPTSLLVLKCSLSETDLNRLFVPLEASQLIERQRVLSDAGRSITLCNLGKTLLQQALQ